ncbi:hypothetical protein Zmor_028472 [Zophobas morio]|uniref:HAT C-terminal dimerisation domain-containing protein n=1 Tax=Zophobas morio TaxID=2755281 RepID=A0AA38M4C1_9CUCU|nr:hypothetical protein Zmor_028472 [Zophobas morio]
MLIDGWKNSANTTKQVVTILKSPKEDRYVFLDSYDITGNSETGEELNEICNRSINLAIEKYKTEVFAVVSDNASNMLKMGRLANKLLHTTCSSHTGNLLAKDVICKDVASKVMKVLREFKHPDLEKELQECGGSKIKLAVDTRWCSYRDSFQCLIGNLRNMKTIAAKDNIKIKQDIIQLLFDGTFIGEVERIIEISDPICKLINECQSTDCYIADAAEKWLHLELPEEFESFLNKRKKMALTIYCLTANFLHPLYRGKSLIETQTDMVHEFLIETLSGVGLKSYQEYTATSGIFQTLVDKEIHCPKTFWGLAERKHPELSDLAKKLHSIPASSGALERLFSNWSFV